MAEIPLNDVDIDVDSDGNEIDSDGNEIDPEAAAMAEAMGFTGFGSQRSKKRKFNPHADAVYDGFSPDDESTAAAAAAAAYSMTGANSAPLGERRRPQMNLPPPAAAPGNGDEIDLDEGDDDVVDDGGRPPRGNVEMTAGETGAQARVDDIVSVSDDAPAPQSRSQPRPQQAQHPGRSQRTPYPDARAAGRAAAVPWWDGPWDAKLIDRMIDNPWDRLEKQAGLEPRGTWGRKVGVSSS
ncbi:hypothetical protein SLS53_001911 [Cytospora paraplurivora]|uniref:Uncharacterized protein n=1 Tax=Cytospora paraplurivora TaxID=2898453 RepID=A0AAN9UED1_9PEZI